MHNRRLSYLLVAVGLMVVFGWWGSGIASAQSGSSTNVKITETEFKLDPASITVPANTPVQVTVTNAGTVPHNLAFAEPAQNTQKQLFSQNLNPGETRTATFTFTSAGQWQMFCPVDGHQSAGMKGTVMVVAPQGSTKSATSGAQATATTAAMTSSTSGATAAATATPAGPRTLPVTGGAAPISFLVLAALVAGVAALMAGLSLAVRRSA